MVECGEVFSTRPFPRVLVERAGLRVASGGGSGWWREARRYRVVISWFTPVGRELFDDPGCVRLVIARSSGFDHIDVGAAEMAGVCVANQPEVITESVAEHALAGILAAARSLLEAFRMAGEWASGGWPGWRLGSSLVYGRSVGLLGAGRIAVSLLSRLAPFRPSRVLYYSRSPKPALEHVFGARRVGLENLFRESEILVNSLPLTGETRGLVTARLLRLLPYGAVYVNVGRGATEEPGAVYSVAWERPDLRFVLDVHPEEPLRPESPRLRLLRRKGVVLTPHVAGYTVESRVGTSLLALLQARAFLERGCVWNPVNGACKLCGSKPYTVEWAIREARRIAVELDQD